MEAIICLFNAIRELETQVGLIFYDQRGCGLSTGVLTPQSISIERYVEDLEMLRWHLGLHRCSLLGHSWGALLAMKYASKYPERVATKLATIAVRTPTFATGRQWGTQPPS